MAVVASRRGGLLWPRLAIHGATVFARGFPESCGKEEGDASQGTPARIVILSSSAHQLQRTAISWDDLDYSKRKYTPRVRALGKAPFTCALCFGNRLSSLASICNACSGSRKKKLSQAGLSCQIWHDVIVEISARDPRDSVSSCDVQAAYGQSKLANVLYAKALATQ